MSKLVDNDKVYFLTYEDIKDYDMLEIALEMREILFGGPWGFQVVEVEHEPDVFATYNEKDVKELLRSWGDSRLEGTRV